jgi:CheY-like chemotaxis protein
MAIILIAEDEPDIRDLIAFTLKFAGHVVHVTSDGAQAVQRVPEVQPDLIMMDVRMPHMTGLEACRALKANPATASIPVIFLSARGQETEISDGFAAGASGYLLKPFAPEELLNRIAAITEPEIKSV